jgi:hypothetical protein
MNRYPCCETADLGKPGYTVDVLTNWQRRRTDMCVLNVCTGAIRAMRKAGCCPRTMARVVDGREKPGALWHIYDPADTDKIRQFLTKVSVLLIVRSLISYS